MAKFFSSRDQIIEQKLLPNSSDVDKLEARVRRLPERKGTRSVARLRCRPGGEHQWLNAFGSFVHQATSEKSGFGYRFSFETATSRVSLADGDGRNKHIVSQRNV